MGRAAWVKGCVLAASLALTHCSGAPSSSPDAPPTPVRPAPPPTPEPASPQAPPYPPLVAEAGYVDVPAQLHGATYAARMFYSFVPAETGAAGKPLFVFFNGGPGAATSAGLHAFGTGPATLDPSAAVGDPPVTNAASFARFANLLYVDERVTGFSYGLRDAAGAAPDFQCRFSMIDDAADFVRVILTFLAAHPALRAAPVALTGESYGGARAISILHVLLHHADAKLEIASDLRTQIEDHFSAVFQGSGGSPPPSTIARQFGTFVLIQPLVLGALQYAAQTTLMPKDPYVGPRIKDETKYDPYDLREPFGWSTDRDIQALAALADPAASKALLGVSLDGIPALKPAARRDAVRPAVMTDFGPELVAAVHQANARLSTRLGDLASGDLYLSTDAPSCAQTGYVEQNTSMAYWFLDALRYGRAFLTHARWDGVIYTPAIPHVFEQGGVPTHIDTAPRPGVARPGWIALTLPKSGHLPKKPVEIRFPSYDAAGHMVAVSQGSALADDVEQWLHESASAP